MDKRATSGRGEPIPSILKKPKNRRNGDFLDKSSKIKREKVEGSKGEDVSAPLPQGCTPLMYACQQADYKAVVDILNKDPSSVRVRDRGLRCALHYCASSGAGASQAARATCADRVLMAAPTLADARDADGLTPLHLAVVHGNVPLVQTLLAAGANVNARDDEHHTVVHWATVCGEVGALRAVLAAGADAATPDQHGGYPLHYAAQMCGAPANTDQQTRGAALEVLRALIKEGGAQVDVRDADGRTPLLWAASAGSAAAVLALHQAGAKVDDADRDGLTALHCAAARGHTEALETLVGLCGARVDVADSHGCTPLHYAAALGHADATAALLQHGSDSHRQDRRGRSPAHTAAAKGQIETIRILGARGANLWLRNSKGDLPLHEAVSSGRRELVKWLLDGRPSQVNATNHEGRTPLHIAAATDNADLCRLLLDRGAEVNPVARSSKNEPITPLDCATVRGHRSTAKYLQMHGGLPASKLANTQIVIDGAPITALPTRRVTSTKIDVRDRIRIEKREVVELSSPIPERRRIKDKNESASSSSSSIDRKSRKRSENKYSGRYQDRRKRLMEPQKSFSDGYDSEFDGHSRDRSHDRKHRKGSKKNRSKSEPRETRRKNDDEKQSVNIIKYKGAENVQSPSTMGKNIASAEDTAVASAKKLESDKENNQLVKSKTHSETETDTLSVKTNMIVTEAQIHMERESSQQGNSEIHVTVDSSNNVSIETANLTVTHKDLNEEKETEQSHLVDDAKETENAVENVEVNKPSSETENKPSSETIGDSTTNVEETQASESIENKEATVEGEPKKEGDEVKVVASEDQSAIETEEVTKDSKTSSQEPEAAEKSVTPTDATSTLERNRRKSFQVLSGPGQASFEDNETSEDYRESGANEQIERDKSSSVSFANKDQIFESKDSDKLSDHPMGEEVTHTETDDQIPNNLQKDSSSTTMSSEDKRKGFASTTGSSSEVTQSIDRGIVTIIGGNVTPTDRAVQQVIMETLSEQSDVNLPISQSSPIRSRKTSKDSLIASRKGSIYETESYKVLSDVASAPDLGSPGILKKPSKIEDAFLEDDRDEAFADERAAKDIVFGRIPSVSDNELYSHSEVNGRRKRFRKKGRTKSRTTIRSKSENSERGYESSGLMDSGFEPSPRAMQRRIMSPRLAAYYQQRNASGRYSAKFDSRIPVRKPGDKHAVDMKSVTQRIQTNMRRYYCERKIFQHLLELKRLQIRTSKANEAVLIKRAIDEYNKSSLSNVGLGPYNKPDYSFSSFEKFLYENLRKLQKSGKKHLDNLPLKPMDFDYGESELYKMSNVPDNPCLCTSKTHRCFHAVHAYTGIPCSAYIPYKWDHHTMPKPATAGPSTKSKGFLPKINSKPPPGKAHVTLEVSHGSERQLIALPAEKLDKNKRYYVTFTVKGSEPPSDNDNVSPTSAKNVRSG
ncbi:ankyrin repeats (3 copies) domain-containing protein [Phthorimaea operculella]|nr:ankyrin repeats (3 copies) domain-containing protein [Phthorimaea operculella]